MTTPSDSGPGARPEFPPGLPPGVPRRPKIAGVILAALYLLWAYQRVFHGEPGEDDEKFEELKLKEGAVLLPFLVAIVFVGVYPKPLLDRIEPSVDALITHVEARSDFESPDIGGQFGVPEHGGEHGEDEGEEGDE